MGIFLVIPPSIMTRKKMFVAPARPHLGSCIIQNPSLHDVNKDLWVMRGGATRQTLSTSLMSLLMGRPSGPMPAAGLLLSLSL